MSTATGQPVRVPFVVTGSSYAIDGSTIATHPPFALYRTNGPLRVAEARSGIYGDGWMGADAAYTRYATKPRGHLKVLLTRTGWSGPDVPGHARIELIPAPRRARRPGDRDADMDTAQRPRAPLHPVDAEPAVHGHGAHRPDVLAVAVRPSGHPPARGAGVVPARLGHHDGRHPGVFRVEVLEPRDALLHDGHPDS